ncbi:MAG TPA: outer membrane protein transport protein, partial [Calditrichia bacterium]|nr:outer membrane protein transport protein [Calditrichia bacterium]
GLAMSGSAEITFPASVNAGIYYKLADNLGVEVDFLYTFWNVFDEIPLNFENDALSQVIPEDYEDAFQLRLGAQYDVNDALALRAGYIYDQTPQPIHSVSPLLPDNDRNDFTAGIGYKTGNLTVDAGFMFVNTGKRSTLENGVGQNENGFNGTYSANATLFFVGLGYHLQ